VIPQDSEFPHASNASICHIIQTCCHQTGSFLWVGLMSFPSFSPKHSMECRSGMECMGIDE
jgi:hypothetical protein